MAEYNGVRGWLLFLCVKLTIILPAIAVAGLVGSATDLRHDGVGRPEAYFVFGEAVGFGLLSMLAIMAGVRLWRRDPAGVSQARLFFLLLIAFALGTVAAAHFTHSSWHAPADVVQEMLSAQWSGSVRAAVAAACWLLYLERSRRVKQTYGIQSQVDGAGASLES